MDDSANGDARHGGIPGPESMGPFHGRAPIGAGDTFGATVERLFAELWSRDVLTVRERRLLLLGLLVGRGHGDMVDVQLDAALRTGELTPDELREIAIFLTYYAGWPTGAELSARIENLISRVMGG